nr:glucose oxidase [Quercus suber]
MLSIVTGFFVLFSTVLAVPTGGRTKPGHQQAAEYATISSDPQSVAQRTFDFVIAGGGLTGLTVASRLSEDPDISVLVIEAGFDSHLDPSVYDVRTYGDAFSSELDHKLTSTPILWQDGAGLSLVAGKTLGGSGSINGASWTKGAASQYDILPFLNGDETWAWEPFNKFMLAAEHFNPPSEKLKQAKRAQYDPSFHGDDGPVQVSFAQGIFDSIQIPALEASEMVWANFSRTADMAAGIVQGGTIIPNMVHPDSNQNRSSPYTAYALAQTQQRDNFFILTGHRVIDIVWKDCDTVAADGVRFQASADSEIHSVPAKREVLLAAGSLQSPQILELSGIGHPDVLENAGVPLKYALPGVGKHMQEQTKNTISFVPKNTDFNGSGPSTAIAFPTVRQLLGASNSTTTYASILASLPAYAASLASQNLVVNSTATEFILRAQLADLFSPTTPPAAAEIFYTISPATGLVGADLWNLIVLARGTAHIQTRDPWMHPTIDPQYFRHPLDLELQTLATQQARRVFSTAPLAAHIAHETLPGLARVPHDAPPAVWTAFVRQTFTSVWHYIGTAAMMKRELGGVVDSAFRVYGVRNVRVVDASVVPIQLSAHLSSTLYGLAEKAAASIKEDIEKGEGRRAEWEYGRGHGRFD